MKPAGMELPRTTTVAAKIVLFQPLPVLRPSQEHYPSPAAKTPAGCFAVWTVTSRASPLSQPGAEDAPNPGDSHLKLGCSLPPWQPLPCWLPVPFLPAHCSHLLNPIGARLYASGLELGPAALHALIWRWHLWWCKGREVAGKSRSHSTARTGECQGGNQHLSLQGLPFPVCACPAWPWGCCCRQTVCLSPCSSS